MLGINPKRKFDIVVAVLSAIAWLPALLLCGLAIAILEGWPVFYVSNRRVGSSVKPVVKFRTMVRNADRAFNRDVIPVSGNVRFLNTPPDSPLYTRIGRLIESYALTEIPQLIHVLKGDMSLVGNRPLPENVIDSLKAAFPKVEDRFLTPAGMTGPVQLVGRAAISDRERLSLEVTYCWVASEYYSWRLDFVILLYTVLIALHFKRTMSVIEVNALIMRFSKEPVTHSEPRTKSQKKTASDIG